MCTCTVNYQVYFLWDWNLRIDNFYSYNPNFSYLCRKLLGLLFTYNPFLNETYICLKRCLLMSFYLFRFIFNVVITIVIIIIITEVLMITVFWCIGGYQRRKECDKLWGYEVYFWNIYFQYIEVFSYSRLSLIHYIWTILCFFP